MRAAFFDTNVLLYGDDDTAGAKRDRAIELFADYQSRREAIISLQVIQEYFVAATRKLGVDPDHARRKIEILARGRVVRLDENDILSAIDLHRLRQISFWDAMIVHAARISGCAVLFTEDLHHGATLAGVEIVNPFHAVQ